MILKHIRSSLKVSREEIFDEATLTPEEISSGKIPIECFTVDIDMKSDLAVPQEKLFDLVEKAYGDAGFSFSRRGDEVRKNPDGSLIVHLEVESTIARSLVVMIRQAEFFSLTTFPLSPRSV